MKKLYFHCVGNQISGLGHFSRCLALACILKQKITNIHLLFIGNFEIHALKKLNIAKIDFINISKQECFKEGILQKLDITPKDFILIDSYVASQMFYDRLTNKSLRWGVIDDFATKDFSDSNLVINFRVNADKLFNYSANICALGTKYMPIRLEFEGIRKKNENLKVSPDIKRILICLGGSDLYQVSGKLLRIVNQVFRKSFITILLSDQREASKLKERYQKNQKISVEMLRPDIECLLENTDFLISGGGMLKYEGGYCAIPNATLSQTKEQYQDTLILEEEGVTMNLGLARECDSEIMVKLLSDFSFKKRQLMRSNQLALFPSDSLSNLIDVFEYQFIGA